MKLRAAFLLVCVHGLLLAAELHAGWSSPQGSWLRYPLPGAEVKTLVADPTAKGVFFLGTAQGGIYRSSDGGRTWSAPPGGAPFPGYSVTSLVIDPSRPGHVWAGLTGVLKGGILARSEDRGRTWLEIRRWPERAASRVVAISIQNGRRVLAVGGDYGVELSDDDGGTWRTSAPDLDPGSGLSFLAFHPSRPGTLYCGSFRHPFRSADLGKTWKRIANGMIEDTEVFTLDISAKDPDDFWAATCGWVYRSTDGGGSWTRYRDGLTDRRAHTVLRDPLDARRVLVGTTGGLFESRDLGKSFRRIGGEVVVNALAFDPQAPNVLLIGTESEGILRSEDGGLTTEEMNQGLAEARISGVAETASGRIVVARAADGKSGGLWSVDPKSGKSEKLPVSPPATIVALQAVGERLLAGTHDGIFVSDSGGSDWKMVLPRGARSFVADGAARLLAATDAGVYESRDRGLSWGRMGSLASRVEWVRRARFAGLAVPTFAAEADGKTLWWDGRDFVFQAVRSAPAGKLTGGFGRVKVSPRWRPEVLGLEVDPGRSLLLFRPEDESAEGVALAFPELGLSIAGWVGDPRSEGGLYLATMGRGLFRFVSN